MGDKNPKKQKKKKRVLEKPSILPLYTEKTVDKGQNNRPQKQSRGR